MYEIKRTADEIESVLETCDNAVSNGSSYPGMSYEQGIMEFFMWLVGETDLHPFED